MVFGARLFKKANSIIVEKNDKIEKQNKEKEKIKKEIDELSKLLLDIKKEKDKEKELYENEKNNLLEKLELYKQNINNAKEKYILNLESHYDKTETEYDNLVHQYQQKIESAEDQLKELQSSLTAGVQAQLRERKKEENIQFYKLSISPLDLEDIVKLNTLKVALHNPIILSKLIWTQYFQKQTTEMCNRIFGKETICGIYKITNTKTQQCYIGQSVNVQDRIKQHIKYGLGIDAPATNKLYKAMQNDGVWTYTFELLEKCSRDELDKKEKRWIEIYQSNIYGLNTTKGNH